ncbi:MAG: putative RNA 2'-phosphotransferase [Limisphaerales bacterium]|nr:MAG: putative RNA 2'-phosphotransferase [Limisphaerales bacterium]TXT47526.1 MAG: putative RNA 2'-phosphotransferase [Limisphaerales bacterium]
MNPKDQTRLSKFLSLVLRHQPEQVGITLDRAGWVEIEALLAALNQHGCQLDREGLDALVRASDKQRFALSVDGLRIRASQGHSVSVDLQYEPQPPPELLYHGTPARFVDAIRRQGLLKLQRHHVHLSAEEATAVRVGQRRGTAVVLTIRTGEMRRSGHTFYRSANGVWLVDHVPPQFIEFPYPTTKDE